MYTDPGSVVRTRVSPKAPDISIRLESARLSVQHCSLRLVYARLLYATTLLLYATTLLHATTLLLFTYTLLYATTLLLYATTA